MCQYNEIIKDKVADWRENLILRITITTTATKKNFMAFSKLKQCNPENIKTLKAAPK